MDHSQEKGINSQYNRMHCIASKHRRSSSENHPPIAKVLAPTLQSYTSSSQRAQQKLAKPNKANAHTAYELA